MESSKKKSELEKRDRLELENRRKNVFVTQLGEHREEEKEDLASIPIISEDPGKILMSSANTLQRTLVLKAQVEVHHMNEALASKRREFQSRMEAVAQRRAELEKRQQDNQERALQVDKLRKDRDLKRSWVMQKCQAEARQNEIKQGEIDELVQELERLQVRQKQLQKKVAKNKMFEDYLMKTINQLPEENQDGERSCPIKAIIQRHEILSASNSDLARTLATLSDLHEKVQLELEALRLEHETQRLVLTSELSQLQRQRDNMKEKNKELELNINHNKGHFIFQEFMTEKMEIEKLTTQPGGCRTSRPRPRGSPRRQKVGPGREKQQSDGPRGRKSSPFKMQAGLGFSTPPSPNRLDC
ncbi:uncharacterized protein CCDC197 isoform X2 [Ornithorhynchus anatinus]|uniref:uncharacterized protein CCDC197 isoform X2 n=1 Tax=Ornithorhynchus anatinus TaxID=9258 RepID=UPI0019D49D44|nr:uncharacterized protein CCDC197 isoform X2 [Ornithorhynchus anatinus]